MKSIKKIALLAVIGAINMNVVLAQAKGNINYRDNYNGNTMNMPNSSTQLPESNINVGMPSPHLTLSVKGMANIKADSYVAIFALTQTGKNTEEVNKLLDERLNKINGGVAAMPKVSTFIDMVSFVPMYEYEVEKKIFSSTYNEVPKGFELKKNIHIKFSDANQLNKIVAICAEAETYDLVRVDYFSTKIEEVKKELAEKGRVKMREKIAFAQDLLKKNLDSLHRHFADGYRVFYPIEMYKNYTAYNASAPDAKSGKSYVNRADKSVTFFYQPIFDKEFDFVLQPEILEPSIQVLYELRLQIDTDTPKPIVPTKKEIILVTPNGDLKPLKLD